MIVQAGLYLGGVGSLKSIEALKIDYVVVSASDR